MGDYTDSLNKRYNKPDPTVINHCVNEEENIEFILEDETTYDIRQILIKAGFRRGQVTDPKTERTYKALIRDLPQQ